MVVTILEGRVAREQWQSLRDEYRQATRQLEPGLRQTFLLQSAQDPDVWRIFTVWESRAALEAVRSSGETPRGLQMLRAAGAEPALAIFTVAEQS